MNNSISFTVPLESMALNMIAETLQAMAAKLATNPILTPIVSGESTIEKAPPVLSVVDNKNLEGAADMGGEAAPATSDKPAPAPAATTEAPPGVDVDSTGLPHDLRIHSASKSKLVKDQTWKKKRGIDPALVATVEAELRAAMAAPAATIETVSPTTETTAAAAFAEPGASDKPAPAPAPAANAEPMTFPVLMSKITNAIATETLTQPQILEAVNSKGLASLPLLSARPDLIPDIDALLFPNV